MADLEINLQGEPLRLLPERAAYWPAQQALLVADLHWGKAAAFRAGAVPVPGGTTLADLERLDQALARTDARQLWVLGDLLHARAGRAPSTLAAIAAWRQRHPGLEIVVVRGNHDRRAGDPPPDWDMRVVDEPWPAGPVVLRHQPEPVPGAYTLAGHVHPAVLMRGPGRQELYLPCFSFGPELGLLPAFGSFTGAARLRPGPADRLYVIADDEVVPIRAGNPG